MSFNETLLPIDKPHAKQKQPDRTKPCSCEECRGLCTGRPGIFAPGQLAKAAAEMGMTVPAFFAAFCAVNWWSDDPEAGNDEGWDHITPAWTPEAKLQAAFPGMPFGFRLVPVHGGESTAGRRCTYEDGFTQGPCALLGPNGCRLSFENRPEECRRAYGCSTGEAAAREKKPLHAEVARKWLEPEGLAELAALPAETRRGDE